MIYPKFLNNNSTIIVTSPSSGVGDKILDYEKSINTLIKEGYKVLETPSVRNNSIVSNTPLIRSKELNDSLNSDSDLILIARGGEFLLECFPYLELDNIINKQKWVMGYSDPTSILFSITTKYDIATIYGFNSTSYDESHLCIKNNLDIISGLNIVQSNFDTLDIISNKNEFNTSGRLIGGCIEVLNELAGLSIHDIDKFNNKYASDGIIWYFDIYEMNSNEFYRTLLHLKYLGWFKNVKGIMLSKINNKIEDYYTYNEVLEKVFPNIPYVSDVPIGHVFPRFTLINGSIIDINYKNNSINIEFRLD